MTYMVRTPVLVEAIELARKAGQSVMNGEVEPRIANAGISAARAIQSAVRTDVYVRLNTAKISFLEAQQAEKIEQSGEAKKLEAARKEIT